MGMMESPFIRSVLNVLLRIPAVVLVHLACRTYDVIWSFVAACVVGFVLASGFLLVYLFSLVPDLYRWFRAANIRETTLTAVLLTIPFGATAYMGTWLRSASLDLFYSMPGLIYHLFTSIFLSAVYIQLVIIIQFFDLQKLLKLYRLGLAAGLTIVGAYAADLSTGFLVHDSSNLRLLFGVLCLEVVLSFTVTFLLDLSSNKVYFFAAYSLPVLSAIAGLSPNTVALCLTAANYYNVSFLVTVVLSAVYFRHAYNWLYTEAKSMYDGIAVRREFHAVLYNNKYNIQLLMFGLGYVAITQLAIILEDTEISDTSNNSYCSWYFTLVIRIVTCCDSIVSLLSMSLAVKFLSFLIGHFSRAILHWTFADVGINVIINVIMSGIPFFNVSSDSFFLVLLSTIWLSWKDTLTFHKDSFAVLFFLHDLVPSLLERIIFGNDDVVASMATSYLPNKWKHIRIVLVNAIFQFISIWMIWVIVSDPNLAAFIALLGFRSWTAFAARPLSTVMTYAAFVYDQNCDEPWAYFNDALLGAKFFPVAINFMGCAVSVPLSIIFWYKGQLSVLALIGLLCVLIIKGIFLFNFGRSSWIQISAQRQAVSHVDDLPLVTPHELAEMEERCAVCYQTMTSARRLNCGHRFHSPCLKKWVYVQMVCPVCRAPMTTTPEVTAPAPDVQEDEEEIHGEQEYISNRGTSSEEDIYEEAESLADTDSDVTQLRRYSI